MDIKINIENKHALVDGTPIIVCGNSDYTVQFTFDTEWETLDAKTARFVYVQNGKVNYTDVVFTGESVAVPVLANTREVRVGVFAGDLHTTVPARIPCELSIRCGTGAPVDPTPSQYDQIMELLNAGGGTGGGEGTPYAVQYVTQTLTETQQARARENISAAAVDHTHEEYATAEHTHEEYATAEHTHEEYATAEHTHEEYATAEHTHEEYATADHTHEEYATAEHTHEEYATADHTHDELHTHDNADVLEKLTAEDGVLLYDGAPIEGGSGAVTSVNGKIGAVTLTADDVGALPDTTVIPTTDGLATEEYVDSAVSNIEIPSIAGLATEEYVQEYAQPKGDYLTAETVPTEIAVDVSEEEAVAAGAVLLLDTEALPDPDTEFLTVDNAESIVSNYAGNVILWESTWADQTEFAAGGTLTVEGISNYRYILLDFGAYSAVAKLSDGTLRGGITGCTAAGVFYNYSFYITVSEDTLTFSKMRSAMITADKTTIADSALTITAILGIPERSA